MDLILRSLHGCKDLAEALALKSSGKVVQDRMVRIIFSKNSEQTAIHSVDEGVANALWESFVTCEWAHRAHHALIVRVDGDTNCVPFRVDKALLDVIKGCLGLVGIPRADLFKNRRANLMPRHLQDLLVDVPGNIVSVGVSDIQIEV